MTTTKRKDLIMQNSLKVLFSLSLASALLLGGCCDDKSPKRKSLFPAVKQEAATAVVDSEGAKLFKSKTCFTCHGADGKTPIMPIYPKVTGQSVEYTLQQLQDIKSGARANGQSAAMTGVMHLVSEDEMKILADYLSQLAP
jgi:cytochrome c